MIVTWSPDECPLRPGQVYYAEVAKLGGGTFNAAYVNRANPFAYGQAYADGVPLTGVDLAATLIEEAATGAAAKPPVQFVAQPAIAEAERGTNEFVVHWSTDVPANTRVEFAAVNPPYTDTGLDPALVTDHRITLSGLTPHTLYHFRVSSAAPDRRAAVSRDLVLCTKPRRPNLLANAGFEEGSGPSPRRTIPRWQKSGPLDMAAANGTWFGELKPLTGGWLFQGALNGSTSDGVLFQRLAVTPGRRYTLSAGVLTKALERINNQTVEKYDVWNDRNRLIHVRLGLDPTGGTDPNAASVEWTPRFYSHLHYANPARIALARSNQLTVFIRFQGQGVEWHLYGVDDCVLTETESAPPRLLAPRDGADGSFTFTLAGEAGVTNRIEVSPDLTQWGEATNVFNASGATLVTLPAVGPRQYYRAVPP